MNIKQNMGSFYSRIWRGSLRKSLPEQNNQTKQKQDTALLRLFSVI